MSDFGSMVTIRRADGTSVTPDDVSRVHRTAKELTLVEDGRTSDSADFNLRFGDERAPDGSVGILISLTEYWLGDDESTGGLDSDVLLARDRPRAERFAGAMQQRLGADFEVEAYCDHW